MNNMDASIHQIQLTMRKEMTINGVKEVDSFDECGAILRTVSGELTVEGSDIHVGVLDMNRGLVTLTGKIDAIWYSEQRPGEKRSLFKRKNR